jgi:hypothetical protein
MSFYYPPKGKKILFPVYYYPPKGKKLQERA